MSQQKVINVARGLEKAELVIKNANIVNVLSEEIHLADIAIEDGIIVGIGENYSEIVTPDKYKRINSLTCSYDPYYNETTFSWDLGEFPSIAKSFAISNYEYSESYYLYSILVDSIDPSLNSKIFSGNLTNENYYFYFEYDDGYYYCLGKFEQN